MASETLSLFQCIKKNQRNRSFWYLIGNTAASIIASNAFLVFGLGSRYFHGTKGPSDLSLLVFSAIGGVGTIFCVYVAASVIKKSTKTGAWPESKFWFWPNKERNRRADAQQAMETEIHDRLEKKANSLPKFLKKNS